MAQKKKESFIINVILFLDLCFVFTPHTCVRVRVHVHATPLTPLSFMSVHDGLEAFTRVCRSASGFDASRSRTGGGDGGGDGEEGVECSLVV